MNSLNKIFLGLVLLFGLLPIKGYASDSFKSEVRYFEFIEADEAFIASGYTDNGVYFEVYGKQYDTRALDGILVTRTFIYEGQIQPESTMRIKEYINGDAYSGTLNLTAFYYNYNENITEAEYQGMLYKRIE